MAFFMFGAIGYPMLECLWRGYSHWTMAVAGGTCAAILYAISRLELSLVAKAMLGCLAITAVEFVAGCIVNLRLKMQVWDYSALPFNLMGQVCLRFCVIWFVISFMVLGVLKISGLRF